MTRRFKWTNRSVVAFAEGQDPVLQMEAKARALALKAMDEGWTGPPFDPLALAQWLGLRIEARGDIADARMVPSGDSTITLEYNPTRPRGRLRFSIAHEIAHSLFSDCADEIRNRGASPHAGRDNWQLEVLCNIGAAELLMPLGSFAGLSGETLSIDSVMSLRKEFDVSVEACLIRLVKLSKDPAAAFCASMHEDGQYRLDYVIAAPGWVAPFEVGQVVPEDSVIRETSAIGFTAIGNEDWGAGKLLRLECMGLAPYPGSVTPRVVGFFIPTSSSGHKSPAILEVIGDAMKPRGTGTRIVAHVIPDTGTIWGGNGFASQLRKRFPSAWSDFQQATSGHPPSLGKVVVGDLGDGVMVAHMVAQRGIGKSGSQRLRYAALADCLHEVRQRAVDLDATVHMPRVGTGHGGASWDVVKELLTEELVDRGVPTTVYRLPV
jgi:O-acetyl-ADP-ribose deacetylase (regulator of RNase III)